MKKNVFAFLVSAMVLSHAAFASDNTVFYSTTNPGIPVALNQPVVQPPVYRSSFFMQFFTGPVIQTLSLEDDDGTAEYAGPGFSVGAKLGVNIRKLLAVYGYFGAQETMGDWDIDTRFAHSELSAEDPFYRFFFGAGVSFFPFRKFNNFLNGLFFGADIGMSILEADEDWEDDVDGAYVIVDDLAETLRLQVGQTWRLGQSLWNVGVELYTDIEAVLTTEDEMDDEEEDYTNASFTFGLAVVFMRR